MKVTYLSALLLTLVVFGTVNSQVIEVKSMCKYMDNNVVDKFVGQTAEAIVSVHIKEANDLVDQYKARFDFSLARYIPVDSTKCFSFVFGDNKEKSIEGYLRVPLLPSTKDIGFWPIPANSYAFFPISSSVSPTQSNNFDNWEALLSKSSFQSNAVNNQYGYIWARNDKDGFNYIMRNIYYKNPGLMIPAFSLNDWAGCALVKGSELYRNCAVIQGPLRSGEIFNGPRDYFFSTYKINFCVWLMALVILAYFMWAVGSTTNDNLQPSYENNSWFNHPYYSVWVFGNPEQTKVARITLLLNSWFAAIFASAFVHRGLIDRDIGTRVGAGIAVGFGLTWIVVYFFSTFLRGLTNVHHKYLEEAKACQTHDEKLECLQRYDNRRAGWNYLYYGLTFGWVMGCSWGSQGLTIYFGNTENWYFMLSLGIVIFGQALVLDFVAVLLGRGQGCIARFIQFRGFYIDYDLHRKFESFIADHE